ncbi:InlB B-repeat-containing protein, partial [Lachnospiraceae bacterium 62-35]
MKKRDKIRGICAALAVTLMLPWAAVPGFPAYGQKKQEGSQEVEKAMAVASQSEVRDESSFENAMGYGEDDRLIPEIVQGGETREILPETAATPSEITENKGLKEATPSELAQEFFYDEPDRVPGYYRRGDDSACWSFLGRDGEWHYRTYGRREEEELSGWYSCSSRGEIEKEEGMIFPEKEYMTLAPYIYRASSVGTEEWKELEKDFGIQTEDREIRKQMGENEDKSRYDIWQAAVSFDLSEEKETEYYFYGYIENGEKEDRTEARWRPCDESGNVMEIQLLSAFMPRAVGTRGATVMRQGNTVTIHYEESLGVKKYSNFKSKYAFSIGILFNHASLTGDSYTGFYPENSMVQNYVVKQEIDGICQDMFWRFEDESGIYTYESTEPAVTISGSMKRIKIADKITGTKREWYEDYERESTGFSAVPHIECTLVLTNPSPYITGYGYGVRYVASDGEGGDNNSVSLCVGNVDISGVCQEAHEHAGLTRKEPDCTAPGSLAGTCTFCGMLVNQEIPSLGHQTPDDYDMTSVPGYKIKNCLRCGIRIETVANLYYVEYYGNGSTGGVTGKTTHYIDQASPLAANGFVRTGHRFTGWNREAGGNGAAYHEGQNINNLTLIGGETIRLYAQWQANSYSVTFDGNGGADGRTIIKDYDSPIGSLPQSSRLGYGFDGWWSERAGGEKITEETRIPAENITVYARWIPHTYSVLFEGNGAEEGNMGEESFRYGEEKALPSNRFKRKGYRFTNWEDGEGRRYADGERIQNLTSVDKAVVRLKAGWQPITYLISWHGGDGVTEGQMPVQMLTYDKEEMLLDNQFVKPGYQFKGWSFEENGDGELLENGQKVKNLAKEEDEIIHLYAMWSNSPYKIMFSPNSGTCQTKEKQVFYDIPIGELPVPEKEDYSFLGWFHEKTGEKLREDTIYRYLENIRLIASWELQFEDLGNGTNRRPGPDGIYGTEDDKYYTNGLDEEAGTDDDKRIYPGQDGKYGTADDFYIGNQGEKIFAGSDQAFGTEDDYRLHGIDKNERPGQDLIFGTGDDELWWNGADRVPGTEDDKKVYPGEDGVYGTFDDYYQEDKKGRNPVNIHAGQDTVFGTEDDYIDNGNGTNSRPGQDLTFDTEDDELWWNGGDKKPGTEDDKEIHPGMDGEYGTRDDYID